MPYKNLEDRKAQWKRWREANRERSREIQREYRKRSAKQIKVQNKRSKAKHHARELAEGRLRFAVKRGWIIKPEGLVFHHPDYSRPYYGCWVTQLDHMQIHAGFIDCPPCVDYETDVRAKAEAAKKRGQKKGGTNACRARWQNLQ